MDKKSYTYGRLNRISQILFAILSLLCFIAGLFVLAVFVHSLSKPEGNAVAGMFFLFVGLSIWSPIIYTFLAYLFSDIKTDDTGLYINFLFRTYFVKWGDILDIRPPKFFGLPTFGQTNIIVLKRGLTLFHRLYGIVYGTTFKPSFGISSHMRGYVEFKRKIRQQLKKQLSKG